MTPENVTRIVQAIEHWYELARREERMRDLAVTQGWGHPDSYNVRIRSYRDTARAMRLDLEVELPPNEWHCSCHLMTKSERRAKGLVT